MSNRLSYLEESTVEKHQFEQMESKVLLTAFFKVVFNITRFETLSSLRVFMFSEKRAGYAVRFGRIV